MAFEYEKAKELQESINELITGIKTVGDAGRAKMDDIKPADVLTSALDLDDNGTFDSAKWQELSSEEQEARADRLRHLKTSLEAAAGREGPDDPSHIMHPVYASNRAIFSICIYIVFVVVALLVGVIGNWDDATGTDQPLAAQIAIQQLQSSEEATAALVSAQAELQKAEVRKREDPSVDTAVAASKVDSAEKVEMEEKKALEASAVEAVEAIRDGGATEQTVLMMVIMLGALGGSLHLAASFAKFVGNRQLVRSWLLYYVSIPFVGAILAAVVYMLLRVGLVAPTGNPGAGSSIVNLNLIGIYAFAVLSGMFSKTATEKLGEVFKTLFRTHSKVRDPLKEQQNSAPGGG